MIRIDEKLNKTVMESTIVKESPDAGTLADLNVDKSDFTDKAWKETYEAAKSGAETVEVYLDDLKEETKQYIINELFDGEIENYDVMPLLILDSEAVLAMEDDSIGVRTNENINFLEEYSENSEIPQWFIDTVEALDWSVGGVYGGQVELESYSPEGEDLVVYADLDDLAGSLEANVDCFDIDEHIEMWIQARAAGTSRVPSTRALVEDAEEIAKMYQELADAVAEAARNVDSDEETITEEVFYDSDFSEDEDETLHLGRYIDVEIPDLLQEISETWNAHIYDAGTTRRALNDIRIAYNKLSNVYQELLEGQR